ncbi:diaminobutyrate--2-oxoglutarate transaminase family protein [Pseudomonas sp. nanlin1]|uniref:diaminobutyrate--2-oxoglutarate transaminase family protein n=1 Tax=Pseudomonas sp. nanlin1 TaxID=3040605 RepID=UPI00388E1ED0
MTTYDATQHAEALSHFDRYDSNAKTYARVFNRMLQKGSLSQLWDVSGRAYLDCFACAGALPLGHNPPFVMERVAAFLTSGHLLQALDIPTVSRHEFLKRLVNLFAPSMRDNLKVQFCGPSGSDAVEAALKLCKIATGRNSVIAFHGAYHGMTLGSLSLMGNLKPKQALGGFSAETHFMPFPQANRCPFGLGGEAGIDANLHYLNHVLSDPESGIRKPAMLIVEGIQGEGGCNPAPARWLQGLREITRAHDIPLVLDEIQTGLGRTGDMFAFEHAGIEPDVVLMSKAIGGGFPLSVMAYHKRYDQWAAGAHAGTFRGNQIAMVAGAATIDYLLEHDVLQAVRDKGRFLLERLREVLGRHPCVGEIRGRGLMVGIEIVDPARSSPCAKALPALDGALAQSVKVRCFDKGLLIENGGRDGAVLRLLPALTITLEQLASAVDLIQLALDEVLAERTALSA